MMRMSVYKWTVCDAQGVRRVKRVSFIEIGTRTNPIYSVPLHPGDKEDPVLMVGKYHPVDCFPLGRPTRKVFNTTCPKINPFHKSHLPS